MIVPLVPFWWFFFFFFLFSSVMCWFLLPFFFTPNKHYDAFLSFWLLTVYIYWLELISLPLCIVTSLRSFTVYYVVTSSVLVLDSSSKSGTGKWSWLDWLCTWIKKKQRISLNNYLSAFVGSSVPHPISAVVWVYVWIFEKPNPIFQVFYLMVFVGGLYLWFSNVQPYLPNMFVLEFQL